MSALIFPNKEGYDLTWRCFIKEIFLNSFYNNFIFRFLLDLPILVSKKPYSRLAIFVVNRVRNIHNRQLIFVLLIIFTLPQKMVKIKNESFLFEFAFILLQVHLTRLNFPSIYLSYNDF